MIPIVVFHRDAVTPKRALNLKSTQNLTQIFRKVAYMFKGTLYLPLYMTMFL